MTRMLKVFLCIVCLIQTACAAYAQKGLSDEFDRSVKAYNRLLRWHEMENAVMTYADPEQREDLLKQVDSLKKSGLSVTDFRILSTRYLPEKKSGDVVAQFDYFILPSNRIKTISHRQEWLYQENSKSWIIKTGLPPFE